MGLSLSVIAALCFLLPGITFVLGFSRLHNPDSPPTALDEHVSVGLVAVLVVALIVQGFWFAGIDAIATLGGFSSPSAAQFVALLSGASVGNPAFPKALESLQEFPIRIALYFSAAAVGSWVIGRGINKRIRRRHSASWFDLLRPDGPDFAWLTLEIDMDGCCFLFAGVATEFSVDRTGQLERVVLQDAVKRPLRPPPKPKWRESESPWVGIPGELLVLSVKYTKSINVDYYYVAPDSAEPLRTLVT